MPDFAPNVIVRTQRTVDFSFVEFTNILIDSLNSGGMAVRSVSLDDTNSGAVIVGKGQVRGKSFISIVRVAGGFGKVYMVFVSTFEEFSDELNQQLASLVNSFNVMK